MRFVKVHKRGNALLPAVFLLMFVAIFGAVLLRGALLSINNSARIINVRQAEALAKSGTDYICDYLCGTQGTELFKDLDNTLAALTLSSPTANISVEINSEKLNASITLLSRVETSTAINDEYIVKASSLYRGQKAERARRMSSERIKSGLGDDKVIGTILSTQAKNYDLLGDAFGRAKIKGPVKVENGKSFTSTNYEIDGDLYVNASNSISLTNTKINGNVYLQIDIPPLKPIQLNNVTVDGDIVLLAYKANGDIYIQGTINCKNMYVNAASFVSLTSTINADNVFFAHDLLTNFTGTSIKGTVIKGQEGADAVAAKEREAKPVKIDLSFPSSYDIELSYQNVDEFNTKTHDLTGGKTLNVEADNAVSSNLVKSINVEGDGTMNIWMGKHSKYFNLSDIIINRNSGDAVINFISLSNSGDVSVNKRILDANIINPFSQTVLHSARVSGVIVSESFNFIASGPGDWNYINIDTTVGWAKTGSLPGLGEGSITYKYGSYVK